MLMLTETPKQAELLHIADNLRPSDQDELRMCGIPDARSALMSMAEHTKDLVLASLNDEPTFVFGCARTYSHHGTLWGLGTSRTTRIMPQLGRFIISQWRPWLFDHRKLTRIEVRLPITHVKNRDWLGGFGLRFETLLPGYGVNGETFVQLAMTRNDYVYLQTTPANDCAGGGQYSSSCPAGEDVSASTG